MNLIRKILEKRYRVSKLYVVELDRVTEIKKSGWRTEGYTKSKTIDAKFVSKKKSDKQYNLISQKVNAYARHEDTEFVGDFFVRTRTPMSVYTHKRYISESEIVEFEKEINKEETV
jgi:hypothetical protein